MAEPKKPGTDWAEEVWRAWREMMELAVPGAEMNLPDLGEALGREMAQAVRERAERAEQADEVTNAVRAEDAEIAVLRAAEDAGAADVTASVAVGDVSEGAVAGAGGGGQVRRGDDVASVAAKKGVVDGAVNVEIAGGSAVSAQVVADVALAEVPEESRSVGSVRQWRGVSDIYGGAAGPLFVASGESGGQGSVVAERGGATGWWPGAVMADGADSGGSDGIGGELVEEVCGLVVERLARALEVYVQSR